MEKCPQNRPANGEVAAAVAGDDDFAVAGEAHGVGDGGERSGGGAAGADGCVEGGGDVEGGGGGIVRGGDVAGTGDGGFAIGSHGGV